VYRPQAKGDKKEYYAKDHLGSVRDVLDATGKSIAKYDYDPYGNLINGQSKDLKPEFGYAGMQYHAPSGLYLTKYRAYDPKDGRWLSRDPIGETGGINLYSYVEGDPINEIDPLGLRPLTEHEIKLLEPYIPKIDLDNADIHVGDMPWYAPDWAVGITRGNNIYFKDAKQTFCTPSDIALLGHELVHVGQYREGMTWLSYLLQGSYENNKYEIPAYALQGKIQSELKSEDCSCK
jgi:RHS repeat-associated protein